MYHMILYNRNFVPFTLCHDMHSNSKANTTNKVLLVWLLLKKKKINWDFWDLGIKQYICPDVKS